MVSIARQKNAMAKPINDFVSMSAPFVSGRVSLAGAVDNTEIYPHVDRVARFDDEDRGLTLERI